VSRFTLDGRPLRVRDFSGFDHPQFATLVRILSDGTSTANEVLQSGSVPRRQATVAATLRDRADVEALRALNLSKARVPFVDVLGDILDVVVLDLQVTSSAAVPGHWEYTATLVEAT